MRRDLILSKSKTFDLITSGLLNWEIIPGLTLNSTISYKIGTSVSDGYTPDVLNITYQGVGSIGNYHDSNFSSENFLTYKNTFGENNLSVMAGWTFERYNQRTPGMTGRDFFSDALQNEAMALSSPDNRLINNGAISTGLESVYGRLNYGLKNRYLLTLTARADGSTKFGENHKWGFFPSGAISWKAHEESFIANLGFFNQLKPRISYGLTGNQAVRPYQTKARYGDRLIWDGLEWRSVIGPGYIGASGRFTEWWGIPSRDLRWETTSQLNFGLDLGFINNRLHVNLDYYFKHTTDLIRRRILPPSSAFDYMMINDGVIDNRGIEIMVEYVAVSTKDFTFKPTLTFTKNTNKVVDIGTAEDAGLIQDNWGTEYIIARNDLEWVFGSNIVSVYALGHPMLSFYGFRTDGIVQTLEEGLEAGLQGDAAQPGEIKYVDLNGDGIVDTDGDTEDREIIGSPEPDFMGSLNLSFMYKRFDLSLFMYGVYGNDVLDTQKFNRPSDRAQRWTPDAPNNEYPSVRNNRGWPLVSDYYITDGSYLRLQNLTFGYTTPIKKLKITDLKVYLNIYNLYTFSKFDGYDPEVGVDGIYWGGKPRQRTFTIGVNITF
jgi:TonB-linked SusC/RagA family outer membrane protein